LLSQSAQLQDITPKLEEVPPPLPEPTIVFSEEQNKFINLAVEQRRNLLLVAPAGYGKSAVMKTIIQLFGSSLPSINDQLVCGLCAPTGKAASLIGGRTLHSYLGIGIGRGSVSDWVQRVRSASFLKPTLKALRAVQVLLIDEISMVSAQFLDQISEYLQRIRGNSEPFGGIQMILVGDLCQLPPVEGSFMFRSLEYARAKFQSYQLTKCFRQDDPEFVAMLNEVRFARCSEQTMSTLRKCTNIAPEYANGLTPMRIVSTNKEVDAINERELMALTYDSKIDVITYNARVSQFANPKKAEAYRKADGIPEFVKLAVGCQVVVTQNIGQGIVNGTQGCITAADSKKIELRLQDGNNATIEYFAYKDPEQPDVFLANTLFSYMPVRLGYASTVHKAQGMTLQLLEVDLKRVFAHGQLYTALSRVTDLRGLIVKNLTQRAFICSEAVHEFYRKLGKGGDVMEIGA
jgi:ATP-dependent DNA helicase PIF1